MRKKLTLKQKKFCNEYMKTGNAKQSAINAGYSKQTAYSIGSENLNKPEIIEYIQKQQETEELNTKLNIKKRQEVIQETFDNIMLKIKEKAESIEETDLNKIEIALKCSDQLNKMQGVYINKVKAEIGIESPKLKDIFNQVGGKGLDE